MFTVTYSDEDDDPPAQILLSSTEKAPLKPANSKNKEYFLGVDFTTTVTGLSWGPHSYYFVASDGNCSSHRVASRAPMSRATTLTGTTLPKSGTMNTPRTAPQPTPSTSASPMPMPMMRLPSPSSSSSTASPTKWRGPTLADEFVNGVDYVTSVSSQPGARIAFRFPFRRHHRGVVGAEPWSLRHGRLARLERGTGLL